MYLVGLALPFTRDLFQDDRADITLSAMLWQSLVMVPFGTVLMEEIAFRGVLPAMFRKRLGGGDSPLLKADILAALLFGLWHVLPSWNVNETNPVFRDLLPGPLGRAAAITAGVMGTALAGMGWSWLRNRCRRDRRAGAAAHLDQQPRLHHLVDRPALLSAREPLDWSTHDRHPTPSQRGSRRRDVDPERTAGLRRTAAPPPLA